MRKIPKLYFKNGKYYCENIFTEDDLELYNNRELSNGLDDLNSFLPNGLHFIDLMRMEDKHGIGYFNGIKTNRGHPNHKIPSIFNDNDTVVRFINLNTIFKSSHHLYFKGLIEFNLSDKEKCEYILFCIIQLFEYLQHNKDIIKLNNIYKNNKSIDTKEVPKEYYEDKIKYNRILEIILGLSLILNVVLILGVL